MRARPRFQRQRTWNIGDRSSACASTSSAFSGRQELGHVLEREALPRTEGEHDGVVAGRGLELEVEPPAEAFPEGEPERAVDPTPEGRVDHELHPAGLVEEALEDDTALGRQDAEGAAGRRQVPHDLGRDPAVQTGLAGEPRRDGADVPAPELLVDRFAKGRHGSRRLRSARRRLTQPERHGGRRALGVDHAHDARLDAADPPRGAAEEEHVPLHALDRPVLVDRADRGVVGIRDDPVVGGLGDRAAGRQGREASAAPAAEHPVDADRGGR
jgi:hypothetical protein